MSVPYLGEIRMFAGTYAPAGWQFCNGQLLPVSSNNALFALIGTSYGGDGYLFFALPDLRGRVPLHGAPGVGRAGGQETIVLTPANLPPHLHLVPVSTGPALSDSPTGNRFAGGFAYGEGPGDVDLPPDFLQPAGGGEPLSVMQPSLGIHFIIATEGVWPSQD